MALEKILRELDDVVAARAQRRHLHVDAVEPVVEVQPEPAVLDQPRQRPVGRDDDARVDPARAEAADPLDREILNRAQQLRLRGRRQIRHLVEEQRAVVRVLELAAPAAHAGGRPLLDPEQLRLEQRLDDGGAVDRDERPLPAPTELVDLPRDELLARSRFALDEYGEIGCRDALDALAHGADRLARADERRGAVGRGPCRYCTACRRGRSRAPAPRCASPLPGADTSSRRASSPARTLPRAARDDGSTAPGISKHITFGSRRRIGSSQSAIDRALTSTRSSSSNRSRAIDASLITASPLVTAVSNAAAPRRLSAARLSARIGPAEVVRWFRHDHRSSSDL